MPDKCGARVFEIIDGADFLTLNNGQLLFDTSKAEFNVEYTVEVRASLVDYPDISTVSSIVTAKINSCRVDELTATAS